MSLIEKYIFAPIMRLFARHVNAYTNIDEKELVEYHQMMENNQCMFVFTRKTALSVEEVNEILNVVPNRHMIGLVYNNFIGCAPLTPMYNNMPGFPPMNYSTKLRWIADAYEGQGILLFRRKDLIPLNELRDMVNSGKYVFSFITEDEARVCDLSDMKFLMQ